MALQFTEHVIEEWTDGLLVVQNYQICCNYGGGDAGRELSTRFFQYGRPAPLQTKSMRWIAGWDQGPRGQRRHWSSAELDQVMQRWLATISLDTNPDDYHIVESVQLLLRGALPDGDTFDDDNDMHYLILSRLRNYLAAYMKRNAPLGQQCESLCEQFQGISIHL